MMRARTRGLWGAAGLACALALPARAAGPFSLWSSTEGPASNQFSADSQSVELGVRFHADADGQVTGIRYYKGPANTGPHSGRLWSGGGTLLGAVSFTGGTASGWQTALFPSPIPVVAGSTYVASYHTSSGYAATRFYFAAPRDSPPLHAPASAPGSLNGVYLYGTTPGFPTQSTRQSNYWVDVLFTPAGPASTSCVSSSGGAWENRGFSAQAGQFQASFEATPSQNGIDGIVGLSSGVADAFADLASIVRFNSSGFIDARDGGAYAAAAVIPYTAGTAYRFRLTVNVATHLYSAFVSSGSSPEQLLASDFDFRTEQAAVPLLNNMGLRATGGSLTACHLALAPLGSAATIHTLTPDSAQAGGPGFTLQVAGEGFTASSLVRWNGATRPTTFVNAGALQAAVAAADIAAPGLAAVTVTDGSPDGQSNAKAFIIRGAPTGDWLVTGSVSAGRADTATLLEDGSVLATTGDAENRSPAETYERSSGVWTQTGETGEPTGREAFRLPDGRVLITGGNIQECCNEDAEVFDPAVGLSSPTAPMNRQRQDHTLLRLLGEEVLAAGGNAGGDDGTSHASAEIYNPVTGLWTNTESMAVARQRHAGTRLSNGHILVTGGQVRNMAADPPIDFVTAAAERFDSFSHTWSAVASMSVPRVDHQAVHLADGRVLVMGGTSGSGTALTSTEIFDGSTWQPAAPMSVPRLNHSATLLSNGHVLVAGGTAEHGSADHNSAEIYDPVLDAWSPAGFMSSPRSGHNAMLLPTGEVLVVGRDGGAELFRSNPAPVVSGLFPESRAAGGPGFTLTVRGERFVPGSIVRWNGADRTTSFVSASTLTAQITAADINAVRAASVTVFNPGPGGGASNVDTFLVYDGSATWVPAGRMNHRRRDATATRLTSGRVFVIGSEAEFGVPPEVYDPASDSWSLAIGTSTHTSQHAAVLLSNGKVLVAGGGFPGNAECCQDDADLYDPATNTLSPTGAMTSPRGDFTATLLLDGRVLAAGGIDGDTDPFGIPAAELYDPTTGVWSATGAMGVGRTEHAEARLADGRVLVSGGRGDFSTMHSSAEVFDPATGVWTTTGAMTTARIGHTATRLGDGKVLVAGGYQIVGSDNVELASAELFDPATGVWTPTGSMATPRNGHTATLLPDGRVLVAGDGNSELYDPASGAWSPAGSMILGRVLHGAALLLDGRVLAAGGAFGEPGSANDGRRAELFRAPSVSTAPRSAVVVSLTFDDGSAGQAQAGQLLSDRGLKGTFYVNSAQLGTSGFYMTLADVQGLAAAGHEIGGHTLDHVDLTTVTATEARRQVCDDRAQLAAWGFGPASFAYPFGRFNDPVKAIARDCGYASGRAVDAGFSVAESTPPADAFAIRTPDAVTSSQTVADLQRLVLDAEQGGGGWVPLVFHQICSGCSPLSTSSATLAAFLDWLAARGPQTTVKTVREIVPAASSAAFAFFDGFDYPDGLITNENPASADSPEWLVTEGSLFASGGQGWTGVPDNVAPDATSSNGTGSAMFRALTLSTSVLSDVTARVTVEEYVSVLPSNPWDGVHFFLRYLDAANYYHVSIRRRDARAAIKKRRNGAISTFTTPLYGAPPVGTPLTARAVAATNPNGSVSIQLFVDGALVASAVDTANPIATLGRVGIASENTRLRFDDFTVPAGSAPAGGGGMGVAALLGSPRLMLSFAPATALVRSEYGGRVEREDGTGVMVPEGALAADVEVTVDDADETREQEAKDRRRRARGLAPGSAEIAFSPAGAAFGRPVTVTLAYSPALLAAGGVDEDELRVHAWNPTLGDWESLPSTVDREAKTVSALTPHFSVYQALGPGEGIGVAQADPSFGWKALYAFPNPVRGRGPITIRAQPGIVDSLELRVYDLAGRRVHSSSDFRGRGAFDDGNGLGEQFTYEHAWDVSGVASGVYRYVLTARKAGEPEKRRSGKLAVVK